MSGGLAGKRVVVTQAVHQAPELGALLAERAAQPLFYPCIAISPPEDTSALDAALAAMATDPDRGEGFDWLVLTSANAVHAIAARMEALNLAMAMPPRVAVVGAATAEVVQQVFGWTVDLAPEDRVAEGLADALAVVLQPGQRVLAPQADIARPVLAERLTAAGADVRHVVAYRTVAGSGGVDLPTLLAAQTIDAVTLTSSSTARYLIERLQAEGGGAGQLAGVCIACIGRITAATAASLGLAVNVVADEPSLEGLVAALDAHFLTSREVRLLREVELLQDSLDDELH